MIDKAVMDLQSSVASCRLPAFTVVVGRVSVFQAEVKSTLGTHQSYNFLSFAALL